MLAKFSKREHESFMIPRNGSVPGFLIFGGVKPVHQGYSSIGTRSG
jgi:hypothetical protein